MPEISVLGEILLEYHLAYKAEQKRDVTQREFAEHIGVDPNVYNTVYKGRQKPAKALVRHLAEYFGDLRFYDAAGMPRPDPRLHMVVSNWKDLPDEATKRIAEIVGKYSVGKKKK